MVPRLHPVLGVSLTLLGLVLTGCTAGPPVPPRAPETDPLTRAPQTRHPARRAPPSVVAPPPSYGNKIVMAQRQGRKGQL